MPQNAAPNLKQDPDRAAEGGSQSQRGSDGSCPKSLWGSPQSTALNMFKPGLDADVVDAVDIPGAIRIRMKV